MTWTFVGIVAGVMAAIWVFVTVLDWVFLRDRAEFFTPPAAPGTKHLYIARRKPLIEEMREHKR